MSFADKILDAKHLYTQLGDSQILGWNIYVSNLFKTRCISEHAKTF